MAITVSPVERDVVWVGTEPSEVWRTGDAGSTWEQTSRLETLSSSSEWSFPPRPDTHHVRWIGCHPVLTEKSVLVAAIDVAAADGSASGRSCRCSCPLCLPETPYMLRRLSLRPVCRLKTRSPFVGYALALVTSTLCGDDVDATGLPFGAASLPQIAR
jgi:hypothetical protein